MVFGKSYIEAHLKPQFLPFVLMAHHTHQKYAILAVAIYFDLIAGVRHFRRYYYPNRLRRGLLGM